MRWTAEAVEDLKRLALEGRSASAIAAALGAGRATRSSARRAGSGSSSMAAAPARRRATRAGARRAQWAAVPPRGAGPATGPLALPAFPGHAVEEPSGTPLWRSRDRRDAAGAVRGHPRTRLPVAPRRPESGRIRLLRACAAGGHSYCAGHCRMAYRPTGAARRPASGVRALAGSGGSPEALYAHPRSVFGTRRRALARPARFAPRRGRLQRAAEAGPGAVAST